MPLEIGPVQDQGNLGQFPEGALGAAMPALVVPDDEFDEPGIECQPHKIPPLTHRNIQGTL